MDQNPFLSDMPWVTIVTQVRVVDGIEIETPTEDCVRIWGRVGSGKDDGNPAITDNPLRVFPDKNGLSQQRDF